jgi:hypothetical protein
MDVTIEQVIPNGNLMVGSWQDFCGTVMVTAGV